MTYDYISEIETVLSSTINQFYSRPHFFFNEHEFHQYCFHRLYGRKEFTELYTTSDGKRTTILHPEYNTLARFSRKRIALDPKGSRAKYDIAILNPEFINKNPFKRVQNRDIKLFTKDERENPGNHLIAAIEFKFINKHGKQFVHEMEYDHFKLINGKEVDKKYMLVFSNTNEQEIKYIDKIVLNDKIKFIYIEVTEPTRKKELGLKHENPTGWLSRMW